MKIVNGCIHFNLMHNETFKEMSIDFPGAMTVESESLSGADPPDSRGKCCNAAFRSQDKAMEERETTNTEQAVGGAE